MDNKSRCYYLMPVPLNLLLATVLALGTVGCATDPLLTIQSDHGWPRDLAFSPDNRLWATLEGGRVQSWDIASGEPSSFLQGDHAFRHIAIDPDGELAALNYGIGIQLWSLDTHECLTQLAGAPVGISSLRFSSDSRLVVGTCAYGSTSTREGVYETGLNPVFVWKVSTGELVQRFDQHTQPVADAVFSPDAQSVFSTGSETIDGWSRLVVYHWDITTGEVAERFQGPVGEPVGVAVTDDGQQVVAASSSGRLAVWERGRETPFQTGKLAQTGWDMDTTSDGRLAALASGATTAIVPIPFIWVVWPDVPTRNFDNKVYLYDVQTGRSKGKLGKHAGVVRAVAISPDGQYLASADETGQINVYLLESEDVP